MFKFTSRLIDALVDSRVNQKTSALLKKWHDERQETKDRIESYTAEYRLGKLWIVLSNEIQDITVGYGKEVSRITLAQTPVTVFTNILTGEEFISGGKIIAFTEQRFLALNSLDPNARIALYFQTDYHGDTDKSKSQTETLTDPVLHQERILEAVKKWKNNLHSVDSCP